MLNGYIVLAFFVILAFITVVNGGAVSVHVN